MTRESAVGSTSMHGQPLTELEGMVRSIARRVRVRTALRVEQEELVQLGMLGLMEASERFDPESGVMFSSFAYTRIRGAILDGLGAITGVKRAQLRRLKRQAAANEYVASLDHTNSYGGDARELADAVQGVLFACDLADTLSARNDGDVDEVAPHRTTPERSVGRRELRALVLRVLDGLPESEATLLRAHYVEGKSLSAIGDAQGVSRSWMSRIHTRALNRAREILESEHNLKACDLSTATYP